MTKEQMMEICWVEYKRLGETAFAMNHYDLAKTTDVHDAETWKIFLMEPKVADWIQEELSILQNSELNKLLANISKSRSVGQAQLINALTKLKDGVLQKDGPVFVYMYVPLDAQQEHADNIVKLDADPFLR